MRDPSRDPTEPFYVPGTWEDEAREAGKPLPEYWTPPWYTRLSWHIWIWVTWPAQVREMKAAGFRRVGWMTWEAGPPPQCDELDVPAPNPAEPCAVHLGSGGGSGPSDPATQARA